MLSFVINLRYIYALKFSGGNFAILRWNRIVTECIELEQSENINSDNKTKSLARQETNKEQCKAK